MHHRNVRTVVSINEVAYHRTDRTLVGCAHPHSKGGGGVGASHQSPRVNKKTKWVVGVCHVPCHHSLCSLYYLRDIAFGGKRRRINCARLSTNYNCGGVTQSAQPGVNIRVGCSADEARHQQLHFSTRTSAKKIPHPKSP